MQIKMINTLILDLDGPLLDGRLRHYQCYKDILNAHGFEAMPEEQYWAMKRSRKDRHAQLAVTGADEIYAIFLALWLERIEQKKYLLYDQIQPGALDTLKKWKHEGFRLNLITMRNEVKNLHWELDYLGISPLLDTINAVGISQGSAAKSAAARTLSSNLDVKSILWIGDTEADVEAARLFGCRILLIENGLRTPEYLASLLPDFQTKDLRSIIFPTNEA